MAASRGLAQAYDGIAELWWDDVETLLAGLGSPAGEEARKRLITDQAEFIDFSESRAFMTEEHVIFEA